MMRKLCWFDVGGDSCAATLDMPGAACGVHHPAGLLIVSGGNEIRCGAAGGQAAMAAHFAARGMPVFRYDRRGIGDSEGDNNGFLGSADDIAGATRAFRHYAPEISRIIAFGNCDAASALALFHAGRFDRLLLANPWTIDAAAPAGDALPSSPPSSPPPSPSAAAIRARYWARIKNPRSIIDLLTGKINLSKLAKGLVKAAAKEQQSPLARKLAAAIETAEIPVHILLAARDNTALSFKSAWNGPAFAAARARADVTLAQVDSRSHGFADDAARRWLWAQIAKAAGL